MSGAPVLVTGGAGFVGGHVVHMLAARGRAVRVLDLAPLVAPPEGVEVVAGSVTDPAAVRRAAEGACGVIHAAANARLWARDAAVFEAVNAGGTREVLAAAAAVGVPLVLVSSFTTLVGARARDGEVLDEAAEVAPDDLLGPYPRSKRLAELAVLDAAAAGARACIVLPSAPVGPGDRAMTPPSAMIRDLAAGRTPALIDCLLNLVDVRALAEGIVAALDRGAPGRRYLLAGEDMAMRDLAAEVARIAGVAPPRARVPVALALMAGRVEAVVARLTGNPPAAPLTGVRLAARRVGFSAARARAELCFAPPPIGAALAEAIAWMGATGHLPPAGGAQS